MSMEDPFLSLFCIHNEYTVRFSFFAFSAKTRVQNTVFQNYNVVNHTIARRRCAEVGR